MKKSEIQPVSVRIPPELLKRVDRLAEKERRNRTNMFLVLLESALDRAETKNK